MPRQHVVVDVSQECNCLQILPAAVLVGQPFARFPRVVEVEHRRHGIHPQAIDVKALAPIQSVGGEEIANLSPAEIKNERPPVGMLPTARVGVLVERRAVEQRQRKVVPREVRRHPVKNHADARRVQRINQYRKIVRRSVPARRRVKPRDLITPRRIVGVLGHRHKLDVRKTHLPHVADQFVGEFAVRVRLGVVVLAPRAKMHFINTHRQLKRVLCCALLEPSLVTPRKTARVPDDRRALRRLLEEAPHRVGLEQQPILRVDQLELVMRPLPDLRHEHLPHTGVAQAPHHVPPAVPVVEVADHAHSLGVRRPDGKRRAVDAFDLAKLRAQLVVKPQLVPLADQVQFGVGKCRGRLFVIRPHGAHAVETAPPLARLEMNFRIYPAWPRGKTRLAKR